LPQLRLCRCELLYTLADIQRQNSDYNQALQLSTQALQYADTDPALFQLHYFRAKCYFDNHDVVNAQTEAKIAASISPNNADIQILLSILIQ
jgi:Tfp pilus assembly protein PilF